MHHGVNLSEKQGRKLSPKALANVEVLSLGVLQPFFERKSAVRIKEPLISLLATCELWRRRTMFTDGLLACLSDVAVVSRYDVTHRTLVHQSLSY